jgi:hypothetical protein
MAAYTVRKGKWHIATPTIFINDLAAVCELGQL